MSKPRNRSADLAVYLVVRSAVCLVQALPVRVALGVGRALAWLAYQVDRRHREVARDNLRHAFPGLGADAYDRLVRACFRHFCTMVIEIACLPRRIQVYNWRTYATPVGFDRFIPHLLSDRPLLMVTAHYGNWEVAGYVTGLVGLRTFAIARDLDNPHLHRFFEKFRQKTGQTILGKRDDFDRITAALEAGGKVATLGDQDAGPRGLFVDFFGRPASTHKAVALLALQHDAPMVVLGIPRVGWPMKFAIEIEDVIDPREYAGRRGDTVRVMTERFTNAIERMVRRHPEQYFWLHRRWKHQPPVKKAKTPAPEAHP
ncbi:MAG TPA: lysophospholipid acyltransferase family protein [Gemmataceae bacterium]|nr:lysophospholipid acyltransferase family protein [Gemmataceae bacterium]